MGQIVIGVADMQISKNSGEILVTHALGSCLGIAIYDPVAVVGGLLHVMLPTSTVSPQKAEENPYMFVDTGLPLLFRQAYAFGAEKSRLVVKVAGGASHSEERDMFAIGKRNFIMLRKMFWQNGVMIANQDVGGHAARTMYLEIGSGRVWLHSQGREWEI